MAGQIAELARDTLRARLPRDATRARRGSCSSRRGDRVLAAFPPDLSRRARAGARQPRRDAADVDTSWSWTSTRRRRRRSQAADGATRARRRAHRDLGGRASPRASLAAGLAEADRAPRSTVPGASPCNPTSPFGTPRGDRAGRHGARARRRRDAGDLPGVAPVAIQQGHYAGKLVADRLKGQTTGPFSLLRQGQPRDHRSRPCRRADQLPQARARCRHGSVWLRSAPLLPDRLPEPVPRRPPLEHHLHDPRAWCPADHGRRGGHWAGVTGGGARTPGVEVAGLKGGPGEREYRLA